jgi:hypothetical protein
VLCISIVSGEIRFGEESDQVLYDDPLRKQPTELTISESNPQSQDLPSPTHDPSYEKRIRQMTRAAGRLAWKVGMLLGSGLLETRSGCELWINLSHLQDCIKNLSVKLGQDKPRTRGKAKR